MKWFKAVLRVMMVLPAFVLLPMFLLLFNLGNVGFSRERSFNLVASTLFDSDALTGAVRAQAAWESVNGARLGHRPSVAVDQLLQLPAEELRAGVDRIVPLRMRLAPAETFWANCFDWLDNDSVELELTASFDELDHHLGSILAGSEAGDLDREIAREVRDALDLLPQRGQLAHELNGSNGLAAMAKTTLRLVRMACSSGWAVVLGTIAVSILLGAEGRRRRIRAGAWGLLCVAALMFIIGARAWVGVDAQRIFGMGDGSPNSYRDQLVQHLVATFLDAGVRGQALRCLVEAALLFAFGGLLLVMVGRSEPELGVPKNEPSVVRSP